MGGKIATAATSLGTIQAVFAFDTWVMVDVPGGRSVQRRCASQRDLASVLTTLGIPTAEADAAARHLWQSRPKDAAGSDVRINESKFRSSGLKPWQLVILLVIFLAVVTYVILHGFTVIPLG